MALNPPATADMAAAMTPAQAQTLHEFNTQYEMQNTVQQIITRLGQVQVNGQPFLADAQRTQILRDMNVPVAEAAQQPFNFELDNNVTFDDIIAQCRQRHVNIWDVIRNHGTRAFYHIYYGNDNPPNVVNPDPAPWRKYSRPEAAEKAVEMQQVVHYENSTNIANWTQTMPKLKRLFIARI